MKSSAYWKKRFEQIEQAANNQGVQCYADIEKQYRQAQKQIESQISVWYQRFAKNNNVTLTEAKRMLNAKELAELKWDVNQYIQYGEENAINGTWVKQLENASARFHISRLEALKLQVQQSIEVMFGNQLDSIDSTMRQVYRSGYYHTAFEIQKGVGVGWDFTTLDDKQISKVINRPWAADGRNFSERVWGNRQKLVNELNQTLTQNIVLGKDPQKAIDEIARKMKTSKNAAGRLVMTEEAFFNSAAQKDCFAELDVEQFEIVATLDSHTSDICREMDGKHFKMSEWQIGVTAPPFHVWCRSTTVPYFDDEFDSVGERAARDEETGKTYYVPADMTYKQWQKSFVQGDKTGLQEAVTGDKIEIINNARDFSNCDREQLSEWVNRYYEHNKVVLSDEEMDALFDYGEGSYEAINAVERFEEDSKEYQKVLRSYGVEEMQRAINTTDHLNSAISKFDLDEDIIVHRAVRDASYITGSDNSINALKNMIGKTYTDNGYVSSSLQYQSKFTGNKDDAVHIEITVPKGSNGAFIDDYVSKDEYEFLINRNQRFIVTDAGERVVKVQKYDIKSKSIIEVDKTERYMKVQLLPDENKAIKAQIQKTLDDCKTVNEVEELMKKQGWFYKTKVLGEPFDGNEYVSFNGIDLESAKSIFRQHKKIFDKYPQLKGKFNAITSSKLSSGIEAQCSYGFGHGGITINTTYYSDSSRYAKTYAKEVESGWSPKGTTWESTVMHEMGHAIDDYLTHVEQAAGMNGWKPKKLSSLLRPKVMKACGLTVSDCYKEVSGYSTQDAQEWFAECFAEYMDSPEPRKVASKFGEILEEYLKGVK